MKDTPAGPVVTVIDFGCCLPKHAFFFLPKFELSQEEMDQSTRERDSYNVGELIGSLLRDVDHDISPEVQSVLRSMREAEWCQGVDRLMKLLQVEEKRLVSGDDKTETTTTVQKDGKRKLSDPCEPEAKKYCGSH